MKNKTITINEYKNSLGSCSIIINNARYHKRYVENILNILREFLYDSEVFFGFYRVDGVHLSFDRQNELKIEIPDFFRKYGEIKVLSEYLSVAKTNVDNKMFNYIPSIFDYYLDTILFKPNKKWDFFEQYYFDYQMHRHEDLIIDGFADILFCYCDSGDFAIYYNPEKYCSHKIRKMIEEIFF